MFTLQLLGTLALRDPDGHPIRSALAQPKRMAVLAYLAIHEGSCRRDSLLPIFWPEQDQEHARAALRKVVYHLRQALGERAVIGLGEEEIAFGDEAVRCDAREMRRALGRGEVENAMALYRGDLLPGFFLAEVPDFECWLDAERERLRQEAARGAAALAERCEAAGDLESAVEWTRRRLALGPADESAVRRLICLLEKAGDRAGAIAAYEHFCLHLRLTYDLEPAAETRALMDRVRASSDASVVVSPAERAVPSLGTEPVYKQPRAVSSSPPSPPSDRHGRIPVAPSFRPRWRTGVLLASVLLPTLLLLRGPILSYVESAFGGTSRPSGAAVTEISIAVLPIADVGQDVDAEYLGVGMTDELINALGRLDGLQVASRTSTFALKDDSLDVQEIGRKLGVRYVIEGSLRREGDRVRLTIQLIDVTDGRQKWAESYDKGMSDVLTMQEEISRSVVNALRGPLALGSDALAPHATGDPQAYDEYLRGRFLLSQRTQESVQSAIRHFSSALARDPQYALAHAGLADAYLAQTDWVSPMSVLPKAKEAAEHALSLNDDLYETHLALARLLHRFDWDWDGAEREYKRALELAPEVPTTHYEYASFLRASRRFEEMLSEIRKGLALEKAEATDPVQFVVDERVRLATALFQARRYADAINMAESALDLDSRSSTRMTIVHASDMLGDFVRAEGELEILNREGGTTGLRSFSAARVYAHAGRPEAARRLLATMHDRARTEYVPKDQIAAIYLALGDTSEALGWLETAVDERHWFMVFWNSDPYAESLRSNPRFQRLLLRMNAPE
jgi:TolB-like protein/DNA-binding SARP family transcriptional activator